MSNTAYREFNFGLGEVIDTVRDQARRFAEERIAPRASDIDRSNVFPRDLSIPISAAPVWGIWPTPSLWKRSRAPPRPLA
jgi:isovaleryl-CoA dehydrogenase